MIQVTQAFEQQTSQCEKKLYPADHVIQITQAFEQQTSQCEKTLYPPDHVIQVTQAFEQHISQCEKKLSNLKVYLTHKHLTPEKRLNEYRNSPLHQELEDLKIRKKNFLENPSCINDIQGFFPVLKTNAHINAAMWHPVASQSTDASSSNNSIPEMKAGDAENQRFRRNSDSEIIKSPEISFFESIDRTQSGDTLSKSRHKKKLVWARSSVCSYGL